MNLLQGMHDATPAPGVLLVLLLSGSAALMANLQARVSLMAIFRKETPDILCFQESYTDYILNFFQTSPIVGRNILEINLD